MKNRVLGIFLTLCMLLTALPLTPFAATATTTTATTTGKDIALGSFGLHNADTENAKWDYVYFGTYEDSLMKWRVLSTEGSSTTTGAGTVDTATYKTANGTVYIGNALFMLSESTLFDTSFNGSTASNVWLTSELRDKMQKDIFGDDSNDLKYVLKTTKTDSYETIDYIKPDNSPYSLTWDVCNLSDDTLFALSAREVEQYLGSGDKYANRISDIGGLIDFWMLRSLSTWSSGAYGYVRNDGCVDATRCSEEVLGVRPALNLNTSKLLFTSAAVGGKATTGTALSSNADYSGNEYKVTLLDESRSGFLARLKSISGNTAKVAYSGAKIGTNEYVSVIIRNGNTVKYYGRVVNVLDASAASGDVDIILPDDYSTANGDVLCMFNEQCNGDENTDYASDVAVVPDYRWYTNNTSATEFTISNVSEFLGFANLVNGTNLPDEVSGNVDFSGKTVKLLNNLDLSCVSNWTPIGKTGAVFKGTFDGQSKTISNLKINSDAEYGYTGLFGRADCATIQNFAVSGNIIVTGTDGCVGGIVGKALSGADGDCVISKCRNIATIKSSSRSAEVGGIVGDAECDVIRYCYNQGDVISDSDNTTIGGLVGNISAEAFEFVYSCYNVGSVSATGTSKVGNAVGSVSAPRGKLTMTGVYHLDNGATEGIGATDFGNSGSMTGSADGKSAAAFANGEVAWLLQNAADDADGQVWGQTLTGSGKDAYPVFANESGSNKVYKVTFKVDGEDDMARYANKGGTVSIDDPTKEGHSFDGWYTAATGGTKFNFNTAINEDITLYARFTPNTYTVSYNAGANGTGTVAAGTKTYGVDFTLSSNIFTCTGYTQTGWATTDGGEKVYNLGGSYTANTAVTLYPVWTVNQYTITVKPENRETDITITQDYGTTVTAPTLTRDGYAFDGWDNTFPTTMPAVSMTITAKWKDITAPTGEIKLGTNSWRNFLNHITFGLFFKDTQEITITATDNSGEDVTIEYLLSDKELSATELEDKTFTAYSDKFNINPNNEYVIYAKLTDKSGNVAYINSDGIVLDNVKPVISGIENGETYCAAQTATVSDKYDVTVTVNDEPVTLTNKQFTLSAAEGAQKIVVTDKAGNKTEMTVTVNNGHTGGTADCMHKAKCEVCGNEYGEVNSSNHTTLKHFEAKTATAANEGCIEYWYCEGCGKYFGDKDGKNEISLSATVLSKLPPEIIEGTGQSVTVGEKKALSFRSNAAYSDFIGVTLDGAALGSDKYTTKEGSIIVTLTEEYVSSLSVGEHTVGIVSQSGAATAMFTVAQKAAEPLSPKTSDSANVALFGSLFAASCLLLAALVIDKKAKRF